MTIYLIEHFVIDRWMPLKIQETCFSKTRALKVYEELANAEGATTVVDVTDKTVNTFIAAKYPHYRIAEYISTGHGLQLKIEPSIAEDKAEINTI